MKLSLDLPVGTVAVDPEAANLIARHDARVPDDGSRSGLAVDGVAAVPGNPAALEVRISSRQPLSAPDIIIESDRWTFGKPGFSFGADRGTATAVLPVTSGPDAVGMPGTGVTVTVLDGPRAAETRGAVAAGTARPGWGNLLPFLGLALLGGLVLNLMPCVLPVLSLKLMAALRHQGRARRQVRLGFLATAAGVVASMLVLGGALAALKAAGVAVGWGMQFQQPIFLVAMAAAVTVFAASLAGLLEIRLPSRLATRWAARAGTGSRAASPPGRSRRCWRRRAQPHSSARLSASRWRGARPRSWPSSVPWGRDWPRRTSWAPPSPVSSASCRGRGGGCSRSGWCWPWPWRGRRFGC
ncbi:hypothetical protein [Dankookia sp. P2]|uniref:cytochrome c biogenesis protein CcdA n=1 Tax=Dankookia sp. P2 TaxID=3423955 RepID=UPI003D677A6D